MITDTCQFSMGFKQGALTWCNGLKPIKCQQIHVFVKWYIVNAIICKIQSFKIARIHFSELAEIKYSRRFPSINSKYEVLDLSMDHRK